MLPNPASGCRKQETASRGFLFAGGFAGAGPIDGRCLVYRENLPCQAPSDMRNKGDPAWDAVSMTARNSAYTGLPSAGGRSRRAAPRPWLNRVGASGLCAFAVLCCLFFLSPVPSARAAAPQQFVIDKAALRTSSNTLFADISLSVDDEDGLRDLLKDGAVLELALAVNVERQRSWWTNKSVSEEVFVSGLRHDPLTRDFVVTVPGIASQHTLRDRNLTRLLHISWRKLSLPLASLDLLKQGDEDAHYIVTIAFTLQHTEVPPWLEKSLVFWSSSVVPKTERTLEYPAR